MSTKAVGGSPSSTNCSNDQPAEEAQKFLTRLIDVDKLRTDQAGRNGERSASNGQKSVLGRPQVAPMSANSRPPENGATLDAATANPSADEQPEQHTHLEAMKYTAS